MPCAAQGFRPPEPTRLAGLGADLNLRVICAHEGDDALEEGGGLLHGPLSRRRRGNSVSAALSRDVLPQAARHLEPRAYLCAQTPPAKPLAVPLASLQLKHHGMR